METPNFLQEIATSLLECIRLHPDGGTWDRWYIEVDKRLFTAYVQLDVTFFRQTGVTFMGDTEEFFEPIVNRVTDLEVYETDSLYDELPEEEWNVSYNSEQIRTFINNEIYASGF